MSDWRWEESTRRYRDQASGRYMARKDVLGYVEKSLSASGNAAGELGHLVGSGQLSPADFGALGREEIKQEYLRQYLLGRGGRQAMTPSDWGTVGQQLKEQYAFFKDFEAEIKAGNLSEAQIQARLRMYTNSARQAYEKGHQKNAEALGMDEESWAVDSSVENCDGCLAYQGEGWQEIGYFPEPGDGSTQCLSNCHCEKLYRNSESGEEY